MSEGPWKPPCYLPLRNTHWQLAMDKPISLCCQTRKHMPWRCTSKTGTWVRLEALIIKMKRWLSYKYLHVEKIPDIFKLINLAGGLCQNQCLAAEARQSQQFFESTAKHLTKASQITPIYGFRCKASCSSAVHLAMVLTGKLVFSLWKDSHVLPWSRGLTCTKTEDRSSDKSWYFSPQRLEFLNSPRRKRFHVCRLNANIIQLLQSALSSYHVQYNGNKLFVRITAIA